MKKFFTQPIGELSRQNALFFLVINIVFIGAELSGTTALDAVDDLLNFFWGFSLLSIVIAGYYLAEDMFQSIGKWVHQDWQQSLS